MVHFGLKKAQDKVKPHFRVQNLILIILEKLVKKMFGFDYFRAYWISKNGHFWDPIWSIHYTPTKKRNY